jgi:hypothetical protein
LLQEELQKIVQPFWMLYGGSSWRRRRRAAAAAACALRRGLSEEMWRIESGPRLTIPGNRLLAHNVPAFSYTFWLSAPPTAQDYSEHSKPEPSRLT